MFPYQKQVPRHIFYSALSVVLVLAAGFGWAFITRDSGDSTLKKHAADIIEICAEEPYRPSCYDLEIPKIMDKGVSLEDAFKVTELIQEQDESYWYCHILGHYVSAKEAAKDVSKWTEVVARCPTGVCSNGCLHGSFQERFRGEYVSEGELEELIPEVKSICKIGEGNRDFTGLEQASCYHAIGHLTMYITNADIKRSVEVCDRVSIEGVEDFSNLCYDGAYMQIFQPLEPEDIALVQDIAPETQEEAVRYCNQFTDMRRTSCMMESWPLFIDDIEKNPAVAIDAFCDRGFNRRDETRCYNGLFYVLAARSNFDQESIQRMCTVLEGDTKARCYAHSASRFLETDHRLAQQAVAVCEAAVAEGVGESCYREILFYSSYNYHSDSDSFKALCQALPTPWRDRCLDNEGARMRAPFYE